VKILIVDDAPEKVGEVKKLLPVVNTNQLHLDVASNGLEARQHLTQTQYDLLILDIKLPLRSNDKADKRGGMSLLSEITLSNRFLRPTHVVALTGFDDLRREFESKFNNGQWTIETYDPADLGWRERLKAKVEYIRRTLAQSGQSYETDVCIVTALPSPELDAVRSLPLEWSAPDALDPVTFLYRASLNLENREFSIVASACPRMGMTAAATLTQKLVQQLRPRLLVMTGICAGVPDSCGIGDVILGDPCWDWQMGKYLRDAFEMSPDQISCPLEISQRFNLLREDRPALIAMSEGYPGEKPDRIPAIFPAPIASGSAVLADNATAEVIRKQHRKVVGVDMEMYGVYSAARDSSAPRPMTFGLKGVCDFADHLKNDKYQKFASYMSAQVLYLFLREYLCQLIPAPGLVEAT
jgi:nucleoside phosphorylase/CheY-like chemotaxis protein